MTAEPRRPRKPVRSASNRKARVIVYGLVLAITGAVTATAIATVMRASTGHPPRPSPPVTAGHKHSLPSPLPSRRPAPGAGPRVLLIAADLRLPRLLDGVRDLSQRTSDEVRGMSQGKPLAQHAPPPRHGRNRRLQEPGTGTSNGKR